MANSRRNFGGLWQQIQRDINAGDLITNWTQHSELVGDEFNICAVDARFIEIDSPGAKNSQRVPKDDLAAVYELWDDYIAGQVQRSEIRELTRFSKYIVSILHHISNDRKTRCHERHSPRSARPSQVSPSVPSNTPLPECVRGCGTGRWPSQDAARCRRARPRNKAGLARARLCRRVRQTERNRQTSHDSEKRTARPWLRD